MRSRRCRKHPQPSRADLRAHTHKHVYTWTSTTRDTLIFKKNTNKSSSRRLELLDLLSLKKKRSECATDPEGKKKAAIVPSASKKLSTVLRTYHHSCFFSLFLYQQYPDNTTKRATIKKIRTFRATHMCIVGRFCLLFLILRQHSLFPSSFLFPLFNAPNRCKENESAGKKRENPGKKRVSIMECKAPVV